MWKSRCSTSKARSNQAKHGVRFQQACQVFQDPMALTLFDQEHSLDEDRWITLGQLPDGQYLLVVHTFKQQGDRVDIRIISARKATKNEIRQYEEE
ncbi:BrnT family toxin [bacterium]|nr:BrnT family toxin [bacterium]